MGFLGKLFGKKSEKRKGPGQEPENWDAIVYDRNTVDFQDGEQRGRYVTGCLEQIAEASREMHLLAGEYSLVTGYLTDIEEIEGLPSEETEDLECIARRLLVMEQERERYQGKKNRMRDADYYRMRDQEAEVQEGIRKMQESEEYGQLVKEDLKRLDRERHAYEYRRAELDNMLNNFRGMAVIFLAALAACFLMLLVLQFVFEMNTQVGYLLAAGAAVVAVVVLWIKYTDAEGEKRKVNQAINRLILVQNKVKIRYVNNRNLTDYLYMKYNVDSAGTLAKRWRRYLQEKEERKEYAEAAAKLEYYQKQLVAKMSNYHIANPGRWASKPGALLDKREMVEMRHELIQRRQSLRSQLDYNNGIAETARREIQDLKEQYPMYATEIEEMVKHHNGMVQVDM